MAIKKILFKFSQILLLFFFLLSLFLSSNKLCHAQTPIFIDLFDSNNLDLWEKHSPNGKWFIENNEYIGTATNSSSPTQPSYTIAGDKNWQNYTLYAKVKGTAGADKEILFRVNEQGDYYVINLRSPYLQSEGNDIVLAKKFQYGTQGVTPLEKKEYNNSHDIWYEFRIDVLNTPESVSIKVFINNDLIFDILDKNNPIYNGAIGFEVWPGEYSLQATETINHFDNVIVMPYGSSPPQATIELDVPNLKQYSDPWGKYVYDSAENWVTDNPYISHWGCALTSATMILNFYGYDIDPGGLNDWLKNNKGYTRNGGIWWPAITTFSKIFPNEKSQVLEFSWSQYNSSLLEKEITNGKPVIIKFSEPTHFIVARGKTNTDYLINNPGVKTMSLLSESVNVYKNPDALRLFTPSNSNLSYIGFAVNKNIDISIFDSNGSEIENHTYLQEPLEDDLEHTPLNSEALKIFQYPKPEKGIYKVIISGPPGLYQLDSYIHNNEGNFTFNSFHGLIDENQQDIFTITMDIIPKIEPVLTFDSIIKDLESAHNQQLIKRERIYRFLKLRLGIIKKYQEKWSIKLTKKSLNCLNKLIKVFTPHFIDFEISKILQNDIKTISETLPEENYQKYSSYKYFFLMKKRSLRRWKKQL